QSRIKLDARSAGNIRELQAIDGSLRKVVASGRDKRFRIKRPRSAHIPGNRHAVWTLESDLRNLHRELLGDLVHHHARPWAADAWPWLHQHLCWRQVVDMRELSQGRDDRCVVVELSMRWMTGAAANKHTCG